MGYYITELGGWEDNWLEWRNVYSFKGGEYVLTFSLACADERDMTLSVNGEQEEKFEAITTGGDLEWRELSTKVNLNKGWNVVRLENASSAMPSVDFMTVKRFE